MPPELLQPHAPEVHLVQGRQCLGHGGVRRPALPLGRAGHGWIDEDLTLQNMSKTVNRPAPQRS